jgi:ligand-binding SRPBCC domain-containing protein
MQFLFEQRVAADLERVFSFFADPRNLAVLHRDDGAFRLLRCSGGIEPGNTSWVECFLAGSLPVVLGFRHETYDPPRSFSERLVHGPFARFDHRHEFESTQRGCLVRDVIEVELPFLYGGDLGMRLAVKGAVRRRFELRHRALVRLFGAQS